MEKFCIVKRRRQDIPNPFPAPLPMPEEGPGFRQKKFSSSQEINSKKEPVLSFNLTPGQSQAIRSKGILSSLDKETPLSMNLNLHQGEDGSVVFNFYLAQDKNLMMLKPLQVCQMMQISRSLLNRMVQKEMIKSYKIGRLRRFCLKDIIEILSPDLE